MSDQDLKSVLERARKEIEQTRDADERGKELLRGLQRDIRHLWEESEGRSDQLLSSEKRNLEDAIRHFEVTHPALTAILGELLQALSNAGI